MKAVTYGAAILSLSVALTGTVAAQEPPWEAAAERKSSVDEFLSAEAAKKAASPEEGRKWFEFEAEPDKWVLKDRKTAFYKTADGKVAVAAKFEDWFFYFYVVPNSGSWKKRIDDGPVSEFPLCTECDDYVAGETDDIAVSWSDDSRSGFLNGSTLYVNLGGYDHTHKIPLAGFQSLVENISEYCGEESDIWAGASDD